MATAANKDVNNISPHQQHQQRQQLHQQQQQLLFQQLNNNNISALSNLNLNANNNPHVSLSSPTPSVASHHSTLVSEECRACRIKATDLRKLEPCLHSFCYECLLKQQQTEAAAGSRGINSLRCPTCHKEVELPPNGLEGLNVSTLNDVSKLIDSSESEQQDHQPQAKPPNNRPPRTDMSFNNNILPGIDLWPRPNGGGSSTPNGGGGVPSSTRHQPPPGLNPIPFSLTNGHSHSLNMGGGPNLQQTNNDNNAWPLPVLSNMNGGGTDSIWNQQRSPRPITNGPPQPSFPSSTLSSGLMMNGAVPLSKCDICKEDPNRDTSAVPEAEGRCQNCCEDLCAKCVDAHQRVKMTRSHTIIRYANQGFSSAQQSLSAQQGTASLPSSQGGRPIVASPGGGGAQASSLADVSEASSANSITTAVANLGALGSNGSSDLHSLILGNFNDAKTSMVRSTSVADHCLKQMDACLVSIGELELRIKTTHEEIVHGIRTQTAKFIKDIEEKQEWLIQTANAINGKKRATLELQRQQLQDHGREVLVVKQNLEEGVNNISAWGNQSLFKDNNEPFDEVLGIIKNAKIQERKLRDIEAKAPKRGPKEDEHFSARPHQQLAALHPLLQNWIELKGSADPEYTIAEGDGLRKAILGKDAVFCIKVMNQVNQPFAEGGQKVGVQITGPDGSPVKASLFDQQNGVFRVNWKPEKDGDHEIRVLLRNADIKDSPFRLNAKMGRDYSKIGECPAFVFGKEGEADGDMCRPWGVAVAKDGRIILANRSNSRIEVYNEKGEFSYKFGTAGGRPGEFNRPTSCAVDKNDRIIVADKDNHRVQVFTSRGEFIRTFGEKGSKVGQFTYPWDVAANSLCQILVSDTRNHRIQLFTPEGQFLRRYGFDGQKFKEFDSPRGVSFMPDDRPVVTDFNNHRVVVISQNMEKAQYLGEEGTEVTKFHRPNGVAVDEQGYMIVADSRNNRIQIFASNGTFVKAFGKEGKNPGELDRPSGVAITPDGKIVVVDFGNSRIQVF